mmetsp:Transcript_63162/g.149669  ORF Transcript_63162/g.149669 Transcript_63162/m.149669 type:complete len:312 (+) Transcript_63162:184-1119(+)
MDDSAFIREAVCHKSLRHPCIVQLIGICVSPQCVVTEFMARGSLFSVLRGKDHISWTTKHSIALDIVEGLTYIHNSAMYHRDLKSPNVLLTRGWRAKLGDFGAVRPRAAVLTSTAGTMLWCSPESLEESEFTAKSDIYSLGMLLWEIASHMVPFELNDDAPLFPSAIIEYIRQGNRPHIPTDCPPEWASIFTHCWATHAEERPEIQEVAAQLHGLDSIVADIDRRSADKRGGDFGPLRKRVSSAKRLSNAANGVAETVGNVRDAIHEVISGTGVMGHEPRARAMLRGSSVELGTSLLNNHDRESTGGDSTL